MPRRTFEFECTECRKFFDVKLSTSLNGNFRIHCPNCGHVHYRTVKDGAITDVRFTQNDCKILYDDIWPMKSCCRDYRQEKREEILENGGLRGFFSNAWARATT